MNPVLCQLRKLIARADDLIDIAYPPIPPIPPTTLEAALLLLVPTAGLFKDVSGTVPATVAGDKIAAWKDMRNGLMFTQATVANQPILAFVSGKPVVRFADQAHRLALLSNLSGITVNSSAVFGYSSDLPDYTVFDGPNPTSNLTRLNSTGKAYAGVFLGARLSAWMDVPASGKIVMSLSRQEASYNGRINGVQLASSAAQALNNSGSTWRIGRSVDDVAAFQGDVFGIAIYSTPAGTSHATHIAGVTEIENYISTFYPEAVATLDWNPASGAFASTIGPTPVFSRASAATMIDVTGKVVWGPENVILQSQDLTAAAWTAASGATVVGNAIAAPDGTITADQVNLGGGQTKILYNITPAILVAGQSYIPSIWAKKITPTGVLTIMNPSGPSTGHLTVDCALLDSEWNLLKPGHPAVTVITPFAVFSNNAGLYIHAAPATFSIYLWGAQISRSPSTYLPTTTAPVYGPRITYDPISHQCLGYLAEEQRTNLILNSSDFSAMTAAAIVVAAPVVTVNSATSPSGAQDADSIDFPAVSNAGNVSVLNTVPSGLVNGSTYTLSIYLRGNLGGEKVWLSHHADSVNFLRYQCDLTTSWKRFSFSFVSPGGYVQLGVDRRDASQTATPAQKIFAWGFQMELGAFPTSYIPTTTAAVTRSADVCQITGTDFTGFYNQTEGTVVAGYRYLGHTGYTPIFVFSDNNGFGTNHLRAVWDSGTSNILIDIYSGAAAQASWPGAGGGVIGNDNKVAIAMAANNFNNALNGVIGTVDTVGVTPANQTRLTIDGYPSSFGVGALTISRIQYFNTRLPNAKLIELTTP